MPKLCDSCPLRGDCISEIEGIDGTDYQGVVLSGIRTKYKYSNLSKFIDEEGNYSRLFEGVDTETAYERVEACQGPEEKEETYFFRKKYISKYCGGLGVRPTLDPDREDLWHRAVFPPTPLEPAEQKEQYRKTIRYMKVAVFLTDVASAGLGFWISKESKSTLPLVTLGSSMTLANLFSIRSIKRHKKELEKLEGA